jgi:hypothetical protein
MGVADATPLANYLKSNQTRIITVAVGSNATRDKLGELASDDQSKFNLTDPSMDAFNIADVIRQLLGEFFSII